MANTTQEGPKVDITTGVLPTSGKAVDPKKAATADEDQQGIFINEVNPFEFMRHADLGTGGFRFGHYLTNHSRERDFKERRNYSYYLNFVKRIINALVNPLFREEPVREEKTGNAFFKLFLEDCDQRGHSFGDFMRKVARKVRRYGMYFVVVENHSAESMPKDIATAERLKKHPYVYCYSPETLDEYDWDDLGRLTRVVFREWTANKDGEKVWKYREWTKYGWVLFTKEKNKNTGKVERNVEASGTIDIGVLPIVPIYAEEPDEDEDPVLVHPPLYHIARTNLAVYDICSELRELERNQMFSILAIPRTSGQQVGAMEIGTKNGITYDASSSTRPDFISPDAAIPEAVMKDREFLIKQIFEMASLLGIAAVTVKEESGKAKEWDFQATSETLAHFGDILETAEQQIVHLFGLYLGKELDYTVKYSDNYGLVDLAAETERASTALLLDVSPEVNAEIKKRWTLLAFRDMEKDDLEKLVKSIAVMAEDETRSLLDKRARREEGGEGGGGEPGKDGEDDGAAGGEG